MCEELCTNEEEFLLAPSRPKSAMLEIPIITLGKIMTKPEEDTDQQLCICWCLSESRRPQMEIN